MFSENEGANAEDQGESDTSSDSESNASDTDCEDVGEYEPEPGGEIITQHNFKTEAELIGTHFAYKFSTGWDRGRVTAIVKNKNSPDYGMYVCKFASENVKRCLALHKDDYDANDIWVSIKKNKLI